MFKNHWPLVWVASFQKKVNEPTNRDISKYCMRSCSIFKLSSGVAMGGGGTGGQSATPGREKFAKIGKKRENQEKLGKRGKIGKKRQKIRKVLSITLPLLTDRAGYATEIKLQMLCFNLYTWLHGNKNHLKTYNYSKYNMASMDILVWLLYFCFTETG